ncbi:DUF5723 family protein [Ichthyobacterium seriolicida]|nr:DUF5723 family protein [Ichthyobacterium seriolicida]
MKKSILIGVLMLNYASLIAQDGVLRQMPLSMDRGFLNPSLQPKHTWGIGFSVFENLVGLPISLDDISNNSVDGVVNIYDVYNSLYNKNIYVRNRASVAPLKFFMSKDDFSVFASISVKHTSKIDLNNISEIIDGNRLFIGKYMTIDEVYIQEYSRIEISFGAGLKLNEKLRIGANIKYLEALNYTELSTNRVGVLTDKDTYQVKFYAENDIATLSTSGYDTSGGDTGLYFDKYLPHLYDPTKTSPGFAADIGLSYDIDKNLNISTSLNNIGLIFWTKYSSVHVLDKDLFNDKSLTEILSSLEKDPNKITNDFLSSVEKKDIMPKMLDIDYNISASYILNNRHTFSLSTTLYEVNRIFDYRIQGAYDFRLYKWLDLIAAPSFYKNDFELGAGFVVGWGPVQINMATHDLVDLILINQARSATLFLGINFMFNPDKKKSCNCEKKIVKPNKFSDKNE